MLVTLFGIAIVSSDVQPSNAFLPMLVTLSGITVLEQPLINELVFFSIIAFELSLESYLALFSSTTMLVSDVQPLNILLPM